MRPVHHLHRLLRPVFVHHLHRLLVGEWHYLLLSLWADGFVVLVQTLAVQQLQFVQIRLYGQRLPLLAFVQIRQLQLGHRIVHLDEPGQRHLLLTVPWEPLYLLRRRTILHLSLLVLRQQLSLRDLVLQLLNLGFHLLGERRYHLVDLAHHLLVLRRDYRVPETPQRDFHQHYLRLDPAHHWLVGLRSQRSFVAVHLGHQLPEQILRLIPRCC